MSELLPCPFCGNAKNIAVVNEKHDHSGGYYIACPVCNASTGIRFACGEDPAPLLIEHWNRRAPSSPATEADVRGEREASDSATKLAEMILADCGHSTAITTALRDRVALRIDKYTDARALAAPTAPAQAEFKLPAWTDEAPDWCTPKEAEVWQMGYDCAMGSARSMNSPETISAVLHVPSGVTFEKVIAAVRSEDLVSLTPTAPAPTEPVKRSQKATFTIEGWTPNPEVDHERATFDDGVRHLYGGDTRLAMAHHLTMAAKFSDGGSYAAQLRIMANEICKLATPPSAAQPEPSDAERYRLVRRGQHWSVIDGIGNVLRGDDLDAAIDAIRATKGGKL